MKTLESDLSLHGIYLLCPKEEINSVCRCILLETSRNGSGEVLEHRRGNLQEGLVLKIADPPRELEHVNVEELIQFQYEFINQQIKIVQIRNENSNVPRQVNKQEVYEMSLKDRASHPCWNQGETLRHPGNEHETMPKESTHTVDVTNIIPDYRFLN